MQVFFFKKYGSDSEYKLYLHCVLSFFPSSSLSLSLTPSPTTTVYTTQHHHPRHHYHSTSILLYTLYILRTACTHTIHLPLHFYIRAAPPIRRIGTAKVAHQSFLFETLHYIYYTVFWCDLSYKTVNTTMLFVHFYDILMQYAVNHLQNRRLYT